MAHDLIGRVLLLNTRTAQLVCSVPQCQCRALGAAGQSATSAFLLRCCYGQACDLCPRFHETREKGSISDRDEAKTHCADSLPPRPVDLLRHACQSMPDSSAPDSVVLPVSQHESG